MDDLKSQWIALYSQTLPQLAKARDPAQSKWPVVLDHCFARIILDNAVGNGQKQWDEVLERPAVRNMNEEQFRNAITLGEKIKTGKVDLCQLDEISLRCRGKNKRKYAEDASAKTEINNTSTGSAIPLEDRPADGVHSSQRWESVMKKAKTVTTHQSTLNFEPKSNPDSSHLKSSLNDTETRSPKHSNRDRGNMEEMQKTLHRIQSHPTLTVYRKKLYSTLLSVPKGRYTTYAAMSDFLESSARAVGSGMRNNPFAPDVPCHRVLAANGTIGGFNGDWGKDGKYANKKYQLLRDEGIKFDGTGKVVGEPFRKLHTLESASKA